MQKLGIAHLEAWSQPISCSRVHQVSSKGLVESSRLGLTTTIIGTGKTTTARKMGQVFFDMGFLSAAEVVECSATDLIGSYVGQTGPKTRAQLEKALGKVLFVDEAYRLAEGHFATEAINELVDLLTKPTFMDKIIVILAGYDNDIDNLISVNPGLASRFPEQIIFKDMNPEHCLQVLKRSIEEQDIQTPSMNDPESTFHEDMLTLLKQLISLPSWGNARDIKTLAKAMIGSVFKTSASTSGALTISIDEILQQTRKMLQERSNRNIPSNAPHGLLPEVLQQLQDPQRAIPTATTTSQAKQTADSPPRPIATIPSLPLDAVIQRDDGVSDEVWLQLQADKHAQSTQPTVSASTLSNAESRLQHALTEEQEKLATRQHLEQQTTAPEESEVKELKLKQEHARLEEAAARKARDRAMEELERVRLRDVGQKREEQVQGRLREMGVCCMGYRWIKQCDGYRCAGGSHFVSNGQLGLG